MTTVRERALAVLDTIPSDTKISVDDLVSRFNLTGTGPLAALEALNRLFDNDAIDGVRENGTLWLCGRFSPVTHTDATIPQRMRALAYVNWKYAEKGKLGGDVLGADAFVDQFPALYLEAQKERARRMIAGELLL